MFELIKGAITMNDLSEFPIPHSPFRIPNPRFTNNAFTLVELMAVITIIGVLAAVAGAVYTSTANEAKLTTLRQYVLDVANGQKNYHARNSDYVDPGCVYEKAASSTCKNKYSKLLDFSVKLEKTHRVKTVKGDGSTNCSGSDFSDLSPSLPCESIKSGIDHRWFAVAAWTDFDNDGTHAIVYFDSETPNPMTIAKD
jgi:prepilin-type N-terminal cleavage/methylation domain-containing protein